MVLEGGCTQLWIDVKTLGDEAGGNAEASRTGIAAAQIVHEKRAKNFVGFIVGRLAIRDKVIPAVRSAWPVSYGAAAYEPGDFIARDIPWANMKLADFGLDTKRAKSFPENKVRLSLWQIDTDEQMQWVSGHPQRCLRHHELSPQDDGQAGTPLTDFRMKGMPRPGRSAASLFAGRNQNPMKSV